MHTLSEPLTAQDWATPVISIMSRTELQAIRRLGHARHWSSFVDRLAWDTLRNGPRPSTQLVIAEIELEVLGAHSLARVHDGPNPS